MNYYNEFDPNAAAWLKQLIQLNLIPQGDVDTRSITEVKPHELTGYTQCHFFAGIGGWSYALQLAGWPTDRPVWSMSCPCQPFSSAGKGLGAADERHLWPVAFNLIKECRPQYVFGEQVASAIGHGWLDGISSDLGEEGYACGSAVLGAHSVGSPHIRQRLYWMAYSDSGQCEKLWQCGDIQSEQPVQSASCDSAVSGLAQSECLRCERIEEQRPTSLLGAVDGAGESRESVGTHGSGFSGLEYAECSRLLGSSDSNGESTETRRQAEPDNNREPSEGCADASGLGYSNGERHDGQHPLLREEESRRNEGDIPQTSRPCETGWSRYTLIPCRDGKQRRIESGVEPLAPRLPKGMVCSSDPSAPINPQETAEARVMRLKGYGNAIVPQVAAAFIQAAIAASRN